MEIDPVCGLHVDRLEAFQGEYLGEVYYFCSKACHEAFSRAPGRYVAIPAEEYEALEDLLKRGS